MDHTCCGFSEVTSEVSGSGAGPLFTEDLCNSGDLRSCTECEALQFLASRDDARGLRWTPSGSSLDTVALARGCCRMASTPSPDVPACFA